MTEQRRDRFEAHTPIDGLGGQCVTELVRMRGTDARTSGGGRHDSMDGSSIERFVVVRDQPRWVRMWSALVAVHSAEEFDDIIVERDVTVIAQFADRDA